MEVQLVDTLVTVYNSRITRFSYRFENEVIIVRSRGILLTHCWNIYSVYSVIFFLIFTVFIIITAKFVGAIFPLFKNWPWLHWISLFLFELCTIQRVWRFSLIAILNNRKCYMCVAEIYSIINFTLKCIPFNYTTFFAYFLVLMISWL